MVEKTREASSEGNMIAALTHSVSRSAPCSWWICVLCSVLASSEYAGHHCFSMQ